MIDAAMMHSSFTMCSDVNETSTHQLFFGAWGVTLSSGRDGGANVQAFMTVRKWGNGSKQALQSEQCILNRFFIIKVRCFYILHRGLLCWHVRLNVCASLWCQSADHKKANRSGFDWRVSLMRVRVSHTVTGKHSNTVNTALTAFTAAALHIFHQLLHTPLVRVNEYKPTSWSRAHKGSRLTTGKDEQRSSQRGCCLLLWHWIASDLKLTAADLPGTIRS